jgi:hypothetical protein
MKQCNLDIVTQVNTTTTRGLEPSKGVNYQHEGVHMLAPRV